MNNREAKIIRTYEEHGAKLVSAHGVLTGTKAIVPEDTVVMFLSEPGYCMLVSAGASVSSTFFESRTGLLQFFSSGGRYKNYKHVSDILKRTHFEGQEYLDMHLEFKDPNVKSFGFIRKLPLTRREIIMNNLKRKEQVPTFAETTGTLVHGSTLKLSTVLKRSGPGVYIVSACRVSPYKSKNVPVNVPHPNYWPYIKPVPRPRSGTIANLIKSVPKSLPKSGVKRILKIKRPNGRNYKIISEMSALKKYSNPKSLENKIRNVANHMYRNHPVNIRNMRASNNANLNPVHFQEVKKYIAPLPANVDPRIFQFTLGVLRNKSKVGLVFKKLPWRKKAEFVAYPSRRGYIIYKLLEAYL